MNNAAVFEAWQRRYLSAYLRTPEAISTAAARIAADETPFTDPDTLNHSLILRLVRAVAMPDIAADILVSRNAIASGIAALRSKSPIIADCAMVAAGTRSRITPPAKIICTLYDSDIAAAAAAAGITRSAAAVDRWGDDLAGAVIAIGNAPTALFRLLEHLAAGAPQPALILAFPVGLVGAAEAKQALIEAPLDLSYITLSGRRGGSAIAAAALNTLIDYATALPPTAIKS